MYYDIDLVANPEILETMMELSQCTRQGRRTRHGWYSAASKLGCRARIAGSMSASFGVSCVLGRWCSMTGSLTLQECSRLRRKILLLSERCGTGRAYGTLFSELPSRLIRRTLIRCRVSRAPMTGRCG